MRRYLRSHKWIAASRKIAVDLIQVLASLVVFAAVLGVGVRPSWWLVEKVLTRDISSEPDARGQGFSVLVRTTMQDNRYAVGYYTDLVEGTKLVTKIDDQDIEVINRDLRASISAENSHHTYFRVLRPGTGYTEVQLETPTRGDFWLKNSYRLEGGRAHLLRTMGFGPIFGVLVAILPLLAGVLAVIGCNRFLKKLGVAAHS